MNTRGGRDPYEEMGTVRRSCRVTQTDWKINDIDRWAKSKVLSNDADLARALGKHMDLDQLPDHLGIYNTNYHKCHFRPGLASQAWHVIVPIA